jgi:GNAT superfamily N-acetyltransferase
MSRVGISLDGTTDLPAGKIAAIVTYLEMLERPRLGCGADDALELIRLRVADTGRYLALFRLIGTRWLWYSRLTMGDAAVAVLLADERVEAYVAVERSGQAIGLVELDFRCAGEAELSFFGLVETAIGHGLGQELMNATLVRAWAMPIGRLWVHTCTLDHPAALHLYRKAGFVAYKIGVEVADDPRLSGLLEQSAGQQAPVIAKKSG